MGQCVCSVGIIHYRLCKKEVIIHAVATFNLYIFRITIFISWKINWSLNCWTDHYYLYIFLIFRRLVLCSFVMLISRFYWFLVTPIVNTIFIKFCVYVCLLMCIICQLHGICPSRTFNVYIAIYEAFFDWNVFNIHFFSISLFKLLGPCSAIDITFTTN